MPADARARDRPAAAILAGGAARRLHGAAKEALEVGGIPILERQLAALRAVADPVFIVGGHPARFESRGLTVLSDVYPNRGALGGIYTAILLSPRDRTFVLACDMPFLSVPLLQRMAASDADVVMPRTSRGYEPLCALYSRRCADAIRRRVERSALEAAVVPDNVRVEEIGPEELAAYDPDGRMFVNVNTPHDYERARELVESMTKSPRSYHE